MPGRQGSEVITSAHPSVLAVTGPHDTPASWTRCTRICRKPHDPFTDLVPPQGIKLTPRHYAYLKISEGCNHRCTLLHHSLDARRSRVSRPIGEVMQEAENLVQAPA